MVLAPEGLPASRRSHSSSCVLCFKEKSNAHRPSDVILCLDCRRIALIGRCLLKCMDFDWYMPIDFLRVLIGTCLLNLGIYIGTCLLKPVPLTFELADNGEFLTSRDSFPKV